MNLAYTIRRATARYFAEMTANGKRDVVMRILEKQPDGAAGRAVLDPRRFDVFSAPALDRWLAALPTDEARAELEPAIASMAHELLETRQQSPERGEQESADLQGRAIALTLPEPWPDPVEIGELLNEVASLVAHFCIVDAGVPETDALFVAHAWAHDAPDVSPTLAITSPVKRCGKTKHLTVLSAVVPKPLPASNISAAAVFRTIDAYRPTLLIDEADTFLGDYEELRGILNSSQYRHLATVVRTVGDDHTARQFSTWAPKAIAMIGQLPDTLADRSIEVRMRRKLPSESVARLRAGRLYTDCADLRRKFARFAQDAIEELRGADPEIPSALTNERQGDNWTPLLAIADLAGGDWPQRARKAALAAAGQSIDDEPAEILLLSDVAELFAGTRALHLRTSFILERLVARDDRPWAAWSKGRPVSAHQLSRILKRFSLKPKPFRDGVDTPRGYERAPVEAQAARYCPGRPGSATPATPLAPNELRDCQSATEPPDVADQESGKHLQDNGVAGVADPEAGNEPQARGDYDEGEI